VQGEASLAPEMASSRALALLLLALSSSDRCVCAPFLINYRKYLDSLLLKAEQSPVGFCVVDVE
jgi:hypothetical protein